ncbi:MAG TPA: ABC transporter ATP-binding protein [Candidatus Binataceae bacterium]
MAAPVIETHGLSKIYGNAPMIREPVLREIDFRLLPGHGAFVIGGNGAGKSTLISILAGLCAPSAGVALVFGQDTRSLAARYRKRIGMMTHQSMLYPNLSARENLEFYAALYALPDPAAAAAGWLERVGLEAVADVRVRAFSRGMEQRLAAARAMIAEPALLLLDEPFAALDAESAAMVAGLIRAAVMRGATAMLTAHAAAEIEGVSFDLFELSSGRLLPAKEETFKEETRRGRLRSLLGR